MRLFVKDEEVTMFNELIKLRIEKDISHGSASRATASAKSNAQKQHYS